MSSEFSPIEEASAGIAKGTFDWWSQRISGYIDKLKQGELAFIEDGETVQLVKSQREKPAWKAIQKLITDNDHRIQIQMGFALKRLEHDPAKLQNLREKIVRRYGTSGLHIAQIVQNGVFSRYVEILLEKTETERDIQEGIGRLLGDLNRYTEFIKVEDSEENKINAIVIRITANLPDVFIVFSSGQAIEKSQAVVNAVMSKIQGYVLKLQIEKDPDKLFQFIIKAENQANFG